MEVLEEENPLRIETEPYMKVARGFKRNVGRPAKKNEILFSAPPKSMISILLCQEKVKKLKEDQNHQLEIKNNQNESSREKSEIIMKAHYHLASMSPNNTHELEENSTKQAKKWACEYCSERIFVKKSEYKKHLTSHRVYKCDYPNCSYATKFTSNLKTHKRVHSSEYRYVCDECTFRTKFINSLKTHKRLHNTERLFQCQYCDYKCNSGSNLKKHSMRKHNNISN